MKTWPVVSKKLKKSIGYRFLAGVATAFYPLCLLGSTSPSIEIFNEHLPDFSYAGYKNGEAPLQLHTRTSLSVVDFGAAANDAKDDTEAFHDALAAAEKTEGPVLVQIPSGRFMVSGILYVERDDIVIRGAGKNETRLYFPRPLRYVPDPPELAELRQYLTRMNKRQREKELNIDLAFSQYAWAGGFIWVREPGERVKPYLKRYDKPASVVAYPIEGKRGGSKFKVKQADRLAVGQIININWYNRSGRDSPLLDTLYPEIEVIGSHHWQFPERPLVSQVSRILAIEGDTVEIADTLLHDIQGYTTDITRKNYLQNVGIEDFSIEFPRSAYIAHHVEQGFNGIYLTRVFDGWVKNVDIVNADSGILTDEIANVSIQNVTTLGEHKAHYSVAMGDTHNVLVRNLKVKNAVIHPLSFNTFATKSVYSGCEVYHRPVLDQHSGANHQNLFENITLHVELGDSEVEQRRYPAFKGGGAGYWKPTHGAGNSFWNIQVLFKTDLPSKRPVTLHGVDDGPGASLIGVHGNRSVEIEYGPNARIRALNKSMDEVPSLYLYQLRKRTAREQ